MHTDFADVKNGRKPVTYVHPDMEEVLPETYGLMVYQESIMRVAQRFGGYSLAEADNLRKACGKKIRELMAVEREKFVAGVRRDRVRREGRHAAVRPHRAVRRLRVRQEPLVRLWPRRVPDRVAEGAPSRRVPRRAAHEREGEPGQGRRLPRRVPADGHQGARARRERLVARLHGARASKRRRRASTVAAGTVGLIPFGLSAVRNVGENLVRQHPRGAREERVVRRLLRLLRARRPVGAEQAGHRVADQGRRIRLARSPATRAAVGVRADRRHHARPPPRARPGRHEPVRRRATPAPRPTPSGSRSPTSSSTRPSASSSRRRCSAST